MTHSSTPDSNLPKIISISLIFLAAMLLIACLVLYVMGQTVGEEFSPDDFSRRSFYYNRVPVLNWTLYGKTYTDYPTNNLIQGMLADGLIPPLSTAAPSDEPAADTEPANSDGKPAGANSAVGNPKVWHLSSDLSDSFTSLPSHDCDAHFLVEYLDLTNENGDSYWESWNEKYPNTAALFWPAVTKLARENLYLGMPDLMRLAMSVQTDDPNSFQSKLDRLVQQQHAQANTQGVFPND